MVAVHNGPAGSVALVDPASGALIRTVEPLGATAQATGSYDGEYVVWKESRDPSDVDDFTVREWSAKAGRIRTVGGAHTTRGRVVASTVQDPVISGDRAAWVEGLRSDGKAEVVVLDLATGQRHIAHVGHPGWIALTPDTVLYAESAKPGAPTVIHAIALKTGRAVAPPSVLGHVRGAWGFVSDGTRWAWVAGDPERMYAASTGSAGPERLGAVPEGGGGPPVAITDGIATVPVSAGGLMVADTASDAWAFIPGASYAVPDGHRLLVVQEATSKLDSGGTPIALLPASRARLGC